MDKVDINISASIRALYTKYFWRFLRHIEIFLNHLEGVDILMGRVPVPQNWAELSKYMGK